MKTSHGGVILFIFLIPLGIIGAIAFSLSTQKVETAYNFLYATCGDEQSYHYCDKDIFERAVAVPDGQTVGGGNITVNNIPKNSLRNNNSSTVDSSEEISYYKMHFFVHDTKSNTGREISQEDAQTMTLNTLQTSPDGATLSFDYNNGPDLIFFSASNSGHYLHKGDRRQKMNMIDASSVYRSRNIHFVGWLLDK